MTASRTRWLLMVLLLLFSGLTADRAGAQTSGTVLRQAATTVTGSTNTTVTIDFKVLAGKTAGASTTLLVDMGAEGNATIPPAEPNLPSTFLFRLSKSDVVNKSEFQPTGGADTTTFPSKIVAVKNGGEDPEDPGGLYSLLITHSSATTVDEQWKLEIVDVPQGNRLLFGMVNGVITGYSPAPAPCATQSDPCPPCPSTCGPLRWCCPRKIFPWWKYAEVIWWPKWPVPSPCLSCPRPWEVPVPEGYDRELVALMPFLEADLPLGPGRAGDVKVAINGGEAIGELFDAGGGIYMQMVQHRRGDSPRVRASVGDVSTEELVVGNPRGAVGVDPIFRTLTFVLLLLLIIALIALGRRRRGVATRG